MKKQDIAKKRLQFSRETLRALDVSELKEIAGGSNNGCGGFPTSASPSICQICTY